MKPIIGIVLRKEETKRVVYDDILKAVIKSKGDYLLLSETDIFYEEEKERLNGWLENCDAFLFPGGDNVSDFDIYVLKYALDKNLPILGICLGMQMMASYPEKERLIKLDNFNHKQAGLLYVHQINITKDSNLNKITNKDNINVNSRHQYKVKDSGMFQVVATSPDGVIEAIENPNHPFQIGVQWHPENMINQEETSKKIFSKFIEVAKRPK